jgi:small GTP-binding protein
MQVAKQDSPEFAEKSDEALVGELDSTDENTMPDLLSDEEADDETPEAAPKNGPRTRAKLADENNVQKNIAQKAVKTGWKKRRSPTNWTKLSMDTLTSLPANISIIRSFLSAINWKEAQEEVLEGLGNTVVIVGQPNSGKSTLFNHLKGQPISEVSPRAGTTKELIRTDFGPFTLVDTPGHLPDVMENGMNEASLIVLLIDGTKGLQADDRNLLMTIKQLDKPVIVAVNKIDTLKNVQAGDDLANNVALRLGMAGVIPISAVKGTNISAELIPAMISASPEAALVIGRELPEFRRASAQRIIRNATLVSLAAGLEPIPLVDIPILLGTQVRLVLRIAALYGEPIDSAEALKHARELIVTMISGLGLRYLAEEAAKLVPFGGDLVAGAIAAAATWSIGEVALEYYEGGKSFSSGRLRTLSKTFYQRFRKEKHSAGELQQYKLEDKDSTFVIEELPAQDEYDGESG